jgi:hypothetical protein
MNYEDYIKESYDFLSWFDTIRLSTRDEKYKIMYNDVVRLIQVRASIFKQLAENTFGDITKSSNGRFLKFYRDMIDITKFIDNIKIQNKKLESLNGAKAKPVVKSFIDKNTWPAIAKTLKEIHLERTRVRNALTQVSYQPAMGFINNLVNHLGYDASNTTKPPKGWKG